MYKQLLLTNVFKTDGSYRAAQNHTQQRPKKREGLISRHEVTSILGNNFKTFKIPQLLKQHKIFRVPIM